MYSADRRFLISFNGEIYNHKALRDELGLKPGQLRSASDTEIILHAWQRWGCDALERMVGQWAFAIYDTSERCLWLARDRFGEKPLFYHQDRSALTFSSSIPSLLKAPWVPREIDDDALREYLTLRYVVSPRTILRDIRKLPGGHLLRVDGDGVMIKRWYEPHFSENGVHRSEDAWVEEFDSLFQQACERCLMSDVPVALLLSDGIDSNSIQAALAARDQHVRSFTYALADSTSGLATTDGDAMDLRVTAEDRIATMVPAFASLTEPTGDGAALATWLLIRNAREHATVFLCGHGGDEILGGYRLSQDRFRLSVVHNLARLPAPWVRGIVDRHVYGSEPIDVRRRALRDAPREKIPAAARYIIHRPLPSHDLSALLGTRTDDGYLATIDRLYRGCPDRATDVDRMQEVMVQTFLSENILTFADSVAMDSSAELRMPFLDRDLVAFAMAMPTSMRVGRWPGRTNTKLVLRQWSRGRVADEVIARRKRAFPFGNLPQLIATHRNTLRGYVLESSAVHRALPGVEQWLSHPPEYFRGPWEGTLWSIITLGIWCHTHGVE